MNFICIMLFYNTITMGSILSVKESMSDDEAAETLINWFTINTQCVSTQSDEKNKPVELIRKDTPNPNPKQRHTQYQ
jgi:hypothetical protein